MLCKQRVVFDFSKLMGRIIEKYGTYTAFADAFGMKKNVLSSRLRNKTYFQPDEMLRACELLDLPVASIPLYFYTLEFHKVELD